MNDLHLGHRFDLNIINTANSLSDVNSYRFRFHSVPNCSSSISFLTCLALPFVPAHMLVPLSAADNTTDAMSTITHTETTKAKITVFDS
jgi:hypothetical protein